MLDGIVCNHNYLNSDCMQMHTTQTQRQIDLKLKANLMLALCHSFVDSVDASRSCEHLRQIKQLTGYGLSFGTESDCVVYKLVLDFERNESTFLERFRYALTACKDN